MTLPNRDDNGIRYGYIRADSLDSDLVDDLLYRHGENLSYRDAAKEEIERQAAEWEDECERLSVAAQEAGTDCVLADFEPYLDDFDPQIEEPIIEGIYEDVAYRTSWLGGALHFWIFRSPMIGHFEECSPCVPGAGSLNERTDSHTGVMTYDVPPGWRFVDPGEPRSFADRLNDHE